MYSGRTDRQTYDHIFYINYSKLVKLIRERCEVVCDVPILFVINVKEKYVELLQVSVRCKVKNFKFRKWHQSRFGVFAFPEK